MRKNDTNNYAYIDGANLYKGIEELGWKIDYRRFKIFLNEKYSVNKAYIFLGFVSANANLYRDLQNWGYTIVFKTTLPDSYGEIKGNCDAEMVLQAVSDMYENLYTKAVIVSGDGDFACLVNFLKDRGRFKTILCPNYRKASVLLCKAAPNSILFLDRFQRRLEYKEGSNGFKK